MVKTDRGIEILTWSEQYGWEFSGGIVRRYETLDEFYKVVGLT